MAKNNDAPTVGPKSDAYTGMLVISLGAMILGSALLFVDYNRYPTPKPEEAPRPKTAKDLATLPTGPAPVVNPPQPVPDPKDKAAPDKDKAPPDKDKDKAAPDKDKDKAAPDKDKDKAAPKDKDKDKDKDK